MDTLHKLKRWETQLERGSKILLIRTLLLFFAVSLFTGFVLSRGVYLYQIRAQEKVIASVKETEKQHMDQKINELRMFLYEQSGQK